MRRIKIPQQDFALKILEGLMRKGGRGGGVFAGHYSTYIHTYIHT